MRLLQQAIFFSAGILSVHNVCALMPFNAWAQDMSYTNQVKSVKKHMDQLKVEHVSIESLENGQSDKKIIRKAFVAKRPNALGTVVLCHGYTSSKDESFFFKTFLPHFNAIAFDFRAHGELTDGQYSTIGGDEIYDVQAAVNYVKNDPELSGKPLIGFGFSMGAVSLLRAQGSWQDMFDMLILDSPFDSGQECMSQGIDAVMSFKLFGRKYRLPGKNLIMKSLYNPYLSPVVKKFFKWVTGFNPYQIPTKFVHVAPIESAANIKVPCLFFSCVKDNKVPVEAVRRLYQSVDSPFKRMWITHGFKHCSSFISNPDLYWYKVNSFVRKVLDKDMKEKEKIVDDRVTISVI